MSHYAIVKRDIYEVYPQYEEAIEDSFKNYMNNNKYYINCISYMFKKSDYVETVWEGKINLNEFNIGDKITIEGEQCIVQSIEKSISGIITYFVYPKHIDCENFDELYTECKEKYEANLGLLVDEYKEKYEEKKLERNKKSLWQRIFG